MIVERLHARQYKYDVFPTESPSLETFIKWVEEKGLDGALGSLHPICIYEYESSYSWSQYAVTTREEWLSWNIRYNLNRMEKVRKLAEDYYKELRYLEQLQKKLEKISP